MRWAVLAVSGGIAAASCSSGPDIQPCGIIPDGGCPVGRGGTCADRECSALYDCVDGRWTLAESCAPTGTGGSSTSVATSGSGGCAGVTIDRTGETTGCTPDLQEPDCPADVAESCQPCLSGCVDFFLCTRRGWQTVAFCDDNGEVVLEP